MYDLAIIGGGPAGATLARLLGRKYRVLLLEKRVFGEGMPAASEKCCGGLIDPDAQQMLARFGLGIPKSVLLSPQLFAVRTIDIPNQIERYYQRHYINMDRNEFDRWLESIVPPAADIVNGCVFKAYEEKEDGVRLKYSLNGKEYEENARLLVGADGAFSKVRRQGFSHQPSPDLYVSIQEWFKTKENLDYYGAIFDEEITDFYSWTIPKEDYLILGTALRPGAEVLKKFELLKSKMKKYGYEFHNPVKRNGAFLLRPVKSSQVCTGKGRIALIGEAAGFISPSSAEGLSYAFRSSLALARALENGIEGYHALYCKYLGSLMRDIRIKNLKSPGMYNGYLRKLIMKTGLMSMNIEKMNF